MSFSSLIKQLKKLLKQKKRWVSLGLIIFAAGVSITASAYYLSKDRTSTVEFQEDNSLPVWNSDVLLSDSGPEKQNKEWMDVLMRENEPKQVFHQINYVCGEEISLLGWLEPEEIAQLSSRYPNALLTVNEHSQVYLTEKIDDLSEQCKGNAYFGIDKDGNLSLFKGIPSNDQIIRTFFQLNVQHLKSSLPRETLDQLYNGIRIMDFDDYNSVISTFSDYAVQGNKAE
ncbi:BofC C-terminal domain-containing protein [Paenibacillus sp. J2TS4]|uniref:BofC C-terminal domain-containing protein n=1 Tax=Paenibacillus sp. J2TS4 TaxID=2807194 RepID=UPI001B17BBA1|nr:BofC C-terminal domain-containing protein [Paenibacillus sp. J2TS4]GIP31386.1 hypothetical protein J2TS4_05960 [Paenibacillus sp. J2TS4]